jgi:hypothetical protein
MAAGTLTWARRRLGTTVGWLQMTLVVVTVTAALLGVVGTGIVVNAELTISSIQAQTIPSITQAYSIQGTLSDADRAAANAYLAGGAEAPGPHQRYERDLTVLNRELVRAAARGAGDGSAVAQVDSINSQVSTYVQMVEQARAANRQNLPIGAAYLRLASTLVHRPGTGILASTEALAAIDSQQLARQDLALELTSIALGAYAVVGLTLLGLLVRTQLFLRQRFRRRRSQPLLAAIAVLLIVSAVVGVAAARTAHGLLVAEGQAYPRLVALYLARTLGNDANANESLFLIAHGNGDPSPFVAETKRLEALLTDEVRMAATDAERTAALRAQGAFRAVMVADASIEAQVSQNQYDSAVTLALGSGPGQLGAAFADLDAALGACIAMVQAEFDGAMGEAQPWPVLHFAIPAAVIAIVLLTLRSLQPRIDEYRA